MEEELEDEQNNAEQNNEKLRKVQSDYEKLMADLHLEKSNVAKAEVDWTREDKDRRWDINRLVSLKNAKLLIEKQNRELKDKVAELEETAKGRSKTVISNLEARLAAAEEQLHLEAAEKQRISREFKKNEKRLRDLQAQIEEERKQTENYKEQVSGFIHRPYNHLLTDII